MKVGIKLVSGCKFEATNERGNVTYVEGSPDMGGKNEAVRPMEMILIGLAGCSSLDVLHILQKGHHTVNILDVSVDGERVDAIPAVFKKIHLHYKARGDFNAEKLERAIQLSMEKYCSVTKMLQSTVQITTSYELV